MARLRQTNPGIPGNDLEFICLGCKSVHRLPRYLKFNRNHDLPTFRPDVNFRVGPFKEGHPYHGQIVTCHFRITDGMVRYFTDSTHDLKGKTLGLPDFDAMAALRAGADEARRSLAAPAPEAEEQPAPAGIPD